MSTIVTSTESVSSLLQKPTTSDDRTAGPAIRGYMYQFDKTIIELLAADSETVITIEGSEDYDRASRGMYESVQCKYLQAQKFSLPLIRDAIMPMLADSTKNCDHWYKLYIHCGDMSNFTPKLDIDELKKCLTKKPKGRPPVHLFAKYSEVQLSGFSARLTLEEGESYDRQKQEVMDALMREFKCTEADCQDLFFPASRDAIAELAIKTSVSDRSISKAEFINRTNRRHCMYTRWHAQQVGQDKFIAAMTRRVKAARAVLAIKERLLVIRYREANCLPDCARLVIGLGKNSYGPGSIRTSRPWTVVVDAKDSEIVDLKRALLSEGVIFNDGSEHLLFQASQFDDPPVINTKNRGSRIDRASYYLRVVSYSTYVSQQTLLRRPDHVFSIGRTIPGFENRTYYLTGLPVERILEMLGI
jgi:hypothetical protein